jgi:Porin subfamily
MKMVKSLLLGSAAGFVAIAGAQAADLPVKAKPVEYVKVCSVYGAGFYYIPGTDTCIKVGGYVRAEMNFNSAGSHSPFFTGAQARNTREDTPDYITRVRGIISMDARSQTEWGTLRAYLRWGSELNSQDVSYKGQFYQDRAFIQFAGITVGKTQSFFDFYANALNYSTLVVTGSDTGHGINLFAYTAQFGGGFSATVSLEDNVHRRTGLWDATTNGLTVAAIPGAAIPVYGNYAGARYPDIVANLRVDQPWGSAQVMAAVHDASGSCYGAFCNPGGVNTDAQDATGWAVGAGVQFNLPWAQGDQFWVQGTWARGAASYIGYNTFGTTTTFAMYGNVGTPGTIGSFAGGWAFDGVFTGGPTGIAGSPTNLTDGFQVVAAVQHYWTPALRTSVFGGYSQLNFDAAATASFCAGVFFPGAGATAVAGPGFVCNPDLAVIQVGSRTIWSPVANLDIGVEVLYSRLDQNFAGPWLLAAQGSRAAGLYEAKDQDTWSGVVRFQRNFWP